MDIQLDGSSCPLFPGQIGIWSVDFYGGRKTESTQRRTL